MKTVKKTCLVLGAVLLLVVMVAFYVGEGFDKPYINLGHSEELKHVKIAAVLSGRLMFVSHKNTHVTQGTILAIVKTRLGKGVTARSPVSGEIVDVYEKKGHWVNNGDILYEINPEN